MKQVNNNTIITINAKYAELLKAGKSYGEAMQDIAKQLNGTPCPTVPIHCSLAATQKMSNLCKVLKETLLNFLKIHATLCQILDKKPQKMCNKLHKTQPIGLKTTREIKPIGLKTTPNDS